MRQPCQPCRVNRVNRVNRVVYAVSRWVSRVKRVVSCHARQRASNSGLECRVGHAVSLVRQPMYLACQLCRFIWPCQMCRVSRVNLCSPCKPCRVIRVSSVWSCRHVPCKPCQFLAASCQPCRVKIRPVSCHFFEPVIFLPCIPWERVKRIPPCP